MSECLLLLSARTTGDIYSDVWESRECFNTCILQNDKRQRERERERERERDCLDIINEYHRLITYVALFYRK